MNTALLLSKNTVINSTDRVKEYTNLQDIQTAGFAPGSPEYDAAAAYFGQSMTPYQVVIGAVGAEEEWATALTDCPGQEYGLVCSRPDRRRKDRHHRNGASRGGLLPGRRR